MLLQVKKSKIAVILPAYNDEISIGSIVLIARKYSDQVILVDNGSEDDTAEIAESAGAQVIRHHFNLGKGTAIRTGIENIKETDIIVIMDCDGLHNPEDIKHLILPIENGEADIVNGSRYLNGYSDTSSFRKTGQNLLNIAFKISYGQKITDFQSGFRAIKANTIPCFRFSSHYFGIEGEMLIDAVNAGLKIKEIQINSRNEMYNSTKDHINHKLEDLLNLINEMEFRRPL